MSEGGALPADLPSGAGRRPAACWRIGTYSLGLRSFERHIEQGGEARAPPSASLCHSNASTTAGGDSGGATPPAAGAGREGMRAGPRRVFSQ